MSKELIEELRATFEYHTDGYLIRKKNKKPCGQHGNAGNGYVQVKVGKKRLYAHRVIYAINHGNMPEGDIDHINGNCMDNRIENLRKVSKSENQHNHRMPKNNASGSIGVIWHTRDQKWMAQIRVNNRMIHLGYFTDFEKAVQARKTAKMKYHPTSPEAVKSASECLKHAALTTE